MRKLTPTERKARARAIIAESERSGKGILVAIETVNRRMFCETTRQAARPDTETAQPQRPDKAARRAARIAQHVRESLAATAAAKATAGTRPAAPAPLSKLNELSADDLDAVAFRSVSGARSPFWGGTRESAPAATVSESDAPAPSKPLDKMNAEELGAHCAATFTAFGRAAGYRSPTWAA